MEFVIGFAGVVVLVFMIIAILKGPQLTKIKWLQRPLACLMMLDLLAADYIGTQIMHARRIMKLLGGTVNNYTEGMLSAAGLVIIIISTVELIRVAYYVNKGMWK